MAQMGSNLVPVLEGRLILLMGVISLASGLPLLFASLGPTAHEQIEKPEPPSAKFYNVVVGHWIGMCLRGYSSA